MGRIWTSSLNQIGSHVGGAPNVIVMYDELSVLVCPCVSEYVYMVMWLRDMVRRIANQFGESRRFYGMLEFEDRQREPVHLFHCHLYQIYDHSPTGVANTVHNSLFPSPIGIDIHYWYLSKCEQCLRYIPFSCGHASCVPQQLQYPSVKWGQSEVRRVFSVDPRTL